MMAAARLSAMLFAGALAGCISVLPEPPDPPQTFPLRGATSIERAGATAPFSLSVALPQAPRALAGVDLAIIRANGSLAYVDGAAWAAPTPEGLRGLLVETFDAAGAVAITAPDSASARTDYELRVELNAFELREPDRSGRGEARFIAAARLLDGRSRALVAARTFDIRVPAARGGAAAAANALAEAARQGSAEIAAWTADEGGRAYAARAASSRR